MDSTEEKHDKSEQKEVNSYDKSDENVRQAISKEEKHNTRKSTFLLDSEHRFGFIARLLSYWSIHRIFVAIAIVISAVNAKSFLIRINAGLTNRDGDIIYHTDTATEAAYAEYRLQTSYLVKCPDELAESCIVQIAEGFKLDSHKRYKLTQWPSKKLTPLEERISFDHPDPERIIVFLDGETRNTSTLMMSTTLGSPRKLLSESYRKTSPGWHGKIIPRFLVSSCLALVLLWLGLCLPCLIIITVTLLSRRWYEVFRDEFSFRTFTYLLHTFGLDFKGPFESLTSVTSLASLYIIFLLPPMELLDHQGFQLYLGLWSVLTLVIHAAQRRTWIGILIGLSPLQLLIPIPYNPLAYLEKSQFYILQIIQTVWDQ